MTETRLVAIQRIEYGDARIPHDEYVPVKNGKPVSFVTAYEEGITEEEGKHIESMGNNIGCFCSKCYRLVRKVNIAFNQEVDNA